MPKRFKPSSVAAFLCLAAAAATAQERRPSLLGSRRAAAPAPAAAANAESETKVANEPGKLNFVNTELDMVLKIYGELVNRTVLKDPKCPNVQINLTSREGQELTDAERIEAIEVMLEMNGVHMENYGERFVYAEPRKTVPNAGVPMVVYEPGMRIEETGKVISVLIPFKNVSAKDEGEGVIKFFVSAEGTVQVFERINKIRVTDIAQNINRMLEAVEAIDVESKVNDVVNTYQVLHASATDIKAALEQIVVESQKALEKEGKGQAKVQNAATGAIQSPSLLRRPGAAAPAPESKAEFQYANISDADRGLIRGKVVIIADERSNKLIFITSRENYDFFERVIRDLDVETTPEVDVKVIRLKYADAEDVADMINDLIGNSSSSKSNTRQNTNQNARPGGGSNLTRNTPSPATSTRAPANTRSGESKAGELSKDNVTVLADKRINGLVVMARTEDMPTLLKIIDSMDVKLSQVLIETAIVEVTLGDELKTGIDWVQQGKTYSRQGNGTFSQKLTGYEEADEGDDGAFEGVDGKWYTPVYSWVENTSSAMTRGGMLNGNYMLGGGGGSGASLLNTMMDVGTNAVGGVWGGANPIGSGINYLLKSKKLNIAAVIQASKDDNRSKYVASPIVMTVDNKEATIEATQMRYLLKGYTYSGSTYNGTTVPDYEQKEIGLTIKVTPKINPNGTVMLKVEEEYSQVGANQSIQANVGGSTTSSVSVPTTITRKMSADITLDNMQTVVLGGLTETTMSESETGIPILKDIPWIGKWLFSSTSQSEERKELLVFMTPYVLDDAHAAQNEALRRKKSLSDARPWMNPGGWSASPLADPDSKKEQLRRQKGEWKKQDEDRQAKLALEKATMDRVKELEKQDKAEERFWIDQHREELDTKAREEFDRKLKDGATDAEALARTIRAEKLEKAEAKLDAAAEAQKARETKAE
ncbi:MAG: secretin N-terminal domain-containing protein [Kiritimatiellia bacterium]